MLLCLGASAELAVENTTKELKMVLRTGVDLQNPGSLLTSKGHLYKAMEPVADVEKPDVAAAITALDDELMNDDIAAATKAVHREREAKRTPPNYRDAHLAIIDQYLIDPTASYGLLAKRTGYSRAWISMVFQSDSFRAKLAERQAAVIDPLILASMKERLFGAAGMALDVMVERLEASPTMDNAATVFNATVKATGMGTPTAQPAVVLNQYIARIPEKSLTAEQWAADNKPTLQKQNLQQLESTEYSENGLGASGTGVTEANTADSIVPDPFAAATAAIFAAPTTTEGA